VLHGIGHKLSPFLPEELLISIEAAPIGWKDRLIPIHNENTGAGLCHEVHDRAVSKLVASREKDLSFVGGLLRHGLARLNLSVNG